MRQFDFSPLYRSTVGFDRLFNMFDTMPQPGGGQSYPPYNIERLSENAYRISMAVAGFSDDEIEIEVNRNQLSVKGEKVADESDKEADFLYRGIATRSFERSFQLADHVEVQGAELKNGLLHIELKREIPEGLKPRKIPVSINANARTKGKVAPAKTIEVEAAE